MMDARSVASNRLAAQCRRFPDLDLTPLDTSGLDARDAALAVAIDHAVTRRWLTLVAIIESQLDQAWDHVEAKLQAALLSGSAQLLLLDRLPDHAVINETVEWAKRSIRPKAGGLVNAVLRKVAALRGGTAPENTVGNSSLAADELPLSDGRVWKLTETVFDENSMNRQAQQTSHSLALISHWSRQFGPEAAARLALHSLVMPPIIVRGIDASDSHCLQPHQQPGYFTFVGDHAELVSLLAKHPAAIVQDSTSAAPIQATTNLEPSTVFDICAGKGTKTRQLAELHPKARIIATDIDENRLATLRKTFAGHDRVTIIDHARLREFDGQADLIVFDVPCTNTGVLARRVEAKYRWSPATIEKLTNVQRQIMADAVPLFAPRCRVLYSTCSIEAAENRAQADWLAKWHGFRLVRDQLTLPSGLPGEPASSYTDGGYFALLERG